MAAKSEMPPQPGSYECASTVTVGGNDYYIHTEELGGRLAKAVSMVYLKGQIVHSRDASYAHLLKEGDLPDRLKNFLKDLHRSVVEEFTRKVTANQKQKSDYFQEVKGLLKSGNEAEALKVLQEGLTAYPSDPHLMSYFGCLLSVSANRSTEGIRICREALKRLKMEIPVGTEAHYPLFYLNLGRAYVAGNMKKEAANAFQSGLKVNPKDEELLAAMKEIGVRKKPPIPFLKRENPLNRHIGRIMHRSQKKKG